MPRVRREKCPNSIYHISVRGNNREDIFKDYADREAYLKRLKHYKEKFDVEVYAYCLMTNHVHLLIYDNGQDISKFMQGLSLSYALYFNRKYDRIGHLFQGRFTSSLVRGDAYFIHVSKYIHLNPVKANIITQATEYNWSSFKTYMNNCDKWEIVDTTRILKYFSDEFAESRSLYYEYVNDGENTGQIEAAATLDASYKLEDNMRSEMNKGVTTERVFKVVEKELGVHRLELMRRSNKIEREKRDACIYLLALTTRLPYKAIGDMFCVRPATIGVSIKRMISKMVIDKNKLKKLSKMKEQIVA